MAVALCMALVPISVFAAGLGKLNVMSGLGEPLKADIELIYITPEELSSITATIASEETYAIQDIEKPASHNTIKVEVSKNASGAPILKLKSTQPISEPFLDILIQVDWASGRLLREYTVLLDPPGYAGEADPNAQATQTTQVPVVRHDDGMPSEASSIENSSDATESSTSTLMPSGDALVQEHLTQSGDTLGGIAREMKPEDVSLEQMLVGLYQVNPDAFQGNNMNRLKVGQIIHPPSAEELNAITRKEASGEIKVQTANWNAYRNKLAGIVVDAAPSDTEANSQSAGGKIKRAAEDKSIPASTGPKDVVKLFAGDATATKSSVDNIKTLQERITAPQEEATAREKSVKEAQDRTALLEKQIADMRKLLAMKNGAMSDLQKQAEAPQDKTMESAPAAAEPPKPAAAAAGSVKNPVKKPAPVPEPVPEQSFLSGMLDSLDLGILAPAGGLLALLGGGWMYLRKKREKILADFSQSTNGSMIDANDVDLFAEAVSAAVDELPILSEVIVETLEFPQVDEALAEGVLDISGMTAETNGGNDFSFDVNSIQAEASSIKDEDFSEPRTFDLTTIDLDLKDGKSSVEAAEIPVVISSAEGEPIEVEAKLDLVAAYIEMNGKKGAKELLAEVMTEGGANQRGRAEKLLAKLA